MYLPTRLGYLSGVEVIGTFRENWGIRSAPNLDTTTYIRQTTANEKLEILDLVAGSSFNGSTAWYKTTAGYIHTGACLSYTGDLDALVLKNAGGSGGSGGDTNKPKSIWEQLKGLLSINLLNLDVPGNVNVGVKAEPVQLDIWTSLKKNAVPLALGGLVVIGATAALIYVARKK